MPVSGFQLSNLHTRSVVNCKCKCKTSVRSFDLLTTNTSYTTAPRSLLLLVLVLQMRALTIESKPVTAFFHCMHSKNKMQRWQVQLQRFDNRFNTIGQYKYNNINSCTFILLITITITSNINSCKFILLITITSKLVLGYIIILL